MPEPATPESQESHGSPVGPESLEQRALRGDSEAWDALVAQHGHRVVVSLVARGLRPCEAREIAQEAWVRLIEKQRAGELERLELPGLAIAQARWLHLDAHRRRRAVVPLDAIGEMPSPAGESQAYDRIRLGRALTALEAFSERDRRLFEAAYGPEAPAHAELAARFGLSLQRTRQILCTVRARLRMVLEER